MHHNFRNIAAIPFINESIAKGSVEVPKEYGSQYHHPH
jgi:hypothetical protein